MANDSVLGIDLGTTSVKISIVEKLTRKVKFTSRKETRAQAEAVEALCSEHSEQNVPRIFQALDECLVQIPENMLQSVSHVAVCGQMHGVVLWKKGAFKIIHNKIDLSQENFVSTLITWQDRRCSGQFLSSLPATDTGIPLCSGFGCASLFWLKENTPEVCNIYECAGTVHDCLVSSLCDLHHTVMSNQNATSWGYFDVMKGEWEIDRLKDQNFPIHLLPHVKVPGTVTGSLQSCWHGIPQGTPVSTALGDFQCSVKASIQEQTDTVINISTSAQLAIVLPAFNDKLLPETVQVWPYFGEHGVATAASLTGGNCLEAFLKMLQEWMKELGVDIPEKDELYSRILAIPSSKQDSVLTVTPTLWGERHAPHQTAEVANISINNIKSLGTIWNSVCKGLLRICTK